MVYRLKTIQSLPISIEKAWDFLSDPGNLKTITPNYMGFKILEGAEDKMYAGQIIKYIVSPVLGIPLRWVTKSPMSKTKNILWMSSALGLTAFGITNIL